MYLGFDELAIVTVAAEVIKKPHIDAVPDSDSAVDTNWEANIRRGYLDRQEVYSRTQPGIVARAFVGQIDMPHRTNGCCHHAWGKTKEMRLIYARSSSVASISSCLIGIELKIETN